MVTAFYRKWFNRSCLVFLIMNHTMSGDESCDKDCQGNGCWCYGNVTPMIHYCIHMLMLQRKPCLVTLNFNNIPLNNFRETSTLLDPGNSVVVIFLPCTNSTSMLFWLWDQVLVCLSNINFLHCLHEIWFTHPHQLAELLRFLTVFWFLKVTMMLCFEMGDFYEMFIKKPTPRGSWRHGIAQQGCLTELFFLLKSRIS